MSNTPEKTRTIIEDDKAAFAAPQANEVKAFDAGNADDSPLFVAADGKFLACTQSWTGWYRKSGSVWKICKNSDGYLVTKPGGGNDAWGTGYTWDDVKSAYGLSGVTAYTSTCGPTCG